MEEYLDGDDIYPIDDQYGVCIVMTSSEEYLPYTSVTIHSLLRHSSFKYRYEVILLHRTSFSSEGVSLLRKIFEPWSNCTLRLLQVGQVGRHYVTGHISAETYIRLMLPQLLPHYNRILYLDSDLIILRDVAELWVCPIPENIMLAGVVDFDVVGQYYGPEYSTRYYLDHILKLSHPDRYLQAGVLCVFLDNIRKQLGSCALSHAGGRSKLRYFDQDILNALCHDNINLLDCRWNVVTDCDSERVSHIISHAPATLYNAYLQSRDDPWIIHYSGYRKPWVYPQEDLAEYFHNEVILAHLKPFVYNLEVNTAYPNLARRCINQLAPRQSILRECIKIFYFATQYHLKK